MTITAQQVEHIDQLLVHLAKQPLSDWDARFVEDQAVRLERRGSLLDLSARQQEQLDRLERQHPMTTTASPATEPLKPRPAQTGHNSDMRSLPDFIDELMELDEEKSKLAEKGRDVMKEAKSSGFEPKLVRRVLRAKKVGKEKFQAEEDAFDAYCQATGLLD